MTYLLRCGVDNGTIFESEVGGDGFIGFDIGVGSGVLGGAVRPVDEVVGGVGDGSDCCAIGVVINGLTRDSTEGAAGIGRVGQSKCIDYKIGSD